MLVLWLLDLLLLQYGVAFQRDVLPWPNWSGMYNASQLVQETKTKIQASRTLLDARTTPRSILQERFWSHRVKSNDFNEVPLKKDSTFTRPLYNPEGSTDSYYDSYESSIESGQGDEFNSSTDSDYDSDSSDRGTISDSSEDDYAHRTKRCITLLPLLLSPRRKSNRQLSSERNDRLTSFRNNMLESPRRKHNYRRKQHSKSDLRSSYKYSAPYQGDEHMYENSESEPDTQTQIISTKNGKYNNILKYFTPPHNTLGSTYVAQYSGSNKLFQCIEKCKQRNLAEKIQGNAIELQDRFGEKSSETKNVPYDMLQMESMPSQTDAEEPRSKEIDYIMDQSSHFAQEELSSKSLDTYSSKLNCSYLGPEFSVNPQRDQENDTDEEYFENRKWTLKTMNNIKSIGDKSNEESEILTYPSDKEKIQISTKMFKNNCQTVTDTMKLNNMLKSNTLNHNVMANEDSIPAKNTLIYDDPHITDVLSQNTEVLQEMSQLENSNSSPERSQDKYIGSTANTETNVKSYFYAEYPNTQETGQNNSVEEFEYHDNINGNDHWDNTFSLQGDKSDCRGTENVDAHHTFDDKITHENQLSMGYTDTSHESQNTSYLITGNDKQNNDEGNSNIHSSTEYFDTPDELTEDTEQYDDNLHASNNGYKTELFTRYNIPSKLQNPTGVERQNSDVMTGETQSLTGYTDGSNESEDTRCNNKNCSDKITQESQLSMGYTDTSHESLSTSYLITGNDKQNNDEGNGNIQSSTEYFYTPDELTEDTEHYDDNPHDSNGYKTELFTRYNVPSKFQNPTGVERQNSDAMTGETQSLTGYTDGSSEYKDTRCNNKNCFDSSDTDAESQLTDSSSEDDNEFQDLSELNVGKQRETYNNSDNTNRGSLDSNYYQGIMIQTPSSGNYVGVPDGNIQGFTNHGFSNIDEHSLWNIQGSYSSQYTNNHIQTSSECSYTKSELHDASQHIITTYDPSYEVNQSPTEHSEVQNEYQNTGEYFTGNFYYSTNMIRETQLSNQNSNTSNDFKDTSENYFPDEYDFRNMNGEMHVPATSTEVLSELKETGQHFINHLKDPYISDNTSREISVSLEYSNNSSEFQDIYESSVSNKGSAYESQDTGGEILTSIKDSNFTNSEYHNNQKDSYDSSDIEIKLSTLCSKESDKSENTKECFSSEDSQGVKSSNGEIQPISKYPDNVNEFHDNNEHTIEEEGSPFVSSDITGNTQSTVDFSESLNGLLSTYKHSIVNERERHKACDVREDTVSSRKYVEIPDEFQETHEHFIGDQALYDLNNKYGETQSSTEFSDDSNELHDTVEDFYDVGRTEVSTEYTFILYRFQNVGENVIVRNDLHDFGDINRQIRLSTEYPETQNEFQIYSEYEDDLQADTNGNTEIFNRYSDTQDEFLNKQFTGDSENMYDYNTNYDTTLSSRPSNISCELEAAGENFVRNDNSDIERTKPSGQHSDSGSEDNNEYELGDSKISHIGPTLETTEDAPYPHNSTSSAELSIYLLRLKSENISPQVQENNRFYEDCELSHGDFDRFEDETSTSLRYDSEYTEMTSICNKTQRTSSSDIQLQELHEDTVYLPFENKNDIELSLIQDDDRGYNSDGPFTTQVESSESELSLEQSQSTNDSPSSWVTNLRYAKDKSNEMEYLGDDDFSSSDETEALEYNKQEKCKTRMPMAHIIYNNGQNNDGIQTIALSDASSAETMLENREPEQHTPKVIEKHYYLMPVYIVTPHPSTQADIVISPFSDEEDHLSDGGEKLTLTENKAEIEQILRSYSDYKEYSSNTYTFKPVASNVEDNTLLSEVVSTGPITRYENNFFLSSNGQVTGDRNGYTNKIQSFSDDLKEESFIDTQIPKSTSNQIFHDYLLGDQSLSSDTSQNMVDSNYGENAAWKDRDNQEKEQSLENDRKIEPFYSGRSYNVLDAIYNAHPTLEPPYTSRPLEYLVSSQCFQPGCSTLFGEFVKKIVEEKIEEYHKQIHRKCDQCAATPIQTKDNLFLDKIERASLTQGLDDNGVVLGKASVSDSEEACNSYIAMKLDAIMNMLIGMKEWLMNSSVKGQ